MEQGGPPASVLVIADRLNGVGDLTQARDYIREMLSRGAHVTIASGDLPPRIFDELRSDKNVTVVDLPRIRYAVDTGEVLIAGELQYDGSYQWWPMYAPEARPLIEKRIAALIEASEGVDAVVHSTGCPFWAGEHVFEEEFTALHEHLKKRPVVEGVLVRSILHADSPGLSEDALHAFFTTPHPQTGQAPLLMVLGDKNFIPLDASLADPEIAAHATYCGYIAPERKTPPSRSGDPAVVVTAGGGDFRPQSLEMLRAAIHCKAELREIEKARGDEGGLSTQNWLVICNREKYDHEFDRLTRLARQAGITLSDSLTNEELAEALGNCKITIGHAGQGTESDLMEYGMRAVLLPLSYEVPIRFAADEEPRRFEFHEQTVRARALAERGVQWLAPEELLVPGDETRYRKEVPRLLAERIDKAMLKNEPNYAGIRRNGMVNAADVTLTAIHQARETPDRALHNLQALRYHAPSATPPM